MGFVTSRRKKRQKQKKKALAHDGYYIAEKEITLPALALATKLNVDWKLVTGTGKNGRITVRDIA
ncbi:MAG TPA: E3 binding domain-containing protein, partial [Saprospiraceae bacterium]|nr:E3 binding domain-containing protein [Saprospiraceae bacterium]